MTYKQECANGCKEADGEGVQLPHLDMSTSVRLLGEARPSDGENNMRGRWP